MDFILMLTRNDRTLDEALSLIDPVLDLGVRHVGFKDVGLPAAAMRDLAAKIRERGGVCYLEVVSTTAETVLRSLETGRSIGADRILGGTDVDAAARVLGDLHGYFPFPGRPVGHPTQLQGSAALVSEHCRNACAKGCGGVDLLAYRATDADPLDLVRAARCALGARTLIVAGSVRSAQQIRALARAGVDAFTIGSAIFDGSFAREGSSLAEQVRAVLDACRGAAAS
jgi:hypothetical protein